MKNYWINITNFIFYWISLADKDVFTKFIKTIFFSNKNNSNVNFSSEENKILEILNIIFKVN